MLYTAILPCTSGPKERRDRSRRETPPEAASKVVYELSSIRVNQNKHNKYSQEDKALAHSNGCKVFTNRKSGRNQNLEEQP